ncbi:hypothetical protein OAM71_01090 [Pelagibacteraceae bacterium]|nr:hypothetical protein [Pelagibacteraceae bacterium]
MMSIKNSTIAILIVLAGVGIIFIDHDYSWIISAVFIGVGTGLFYWKDKNTGNEEN